MLAPDSGKCDSSSTATVDVARVAAARCVGSWRVILAGRDHLRQQGMRPPPRRAARAERSARSVINKGGALLRARALSRALLALGSLTPTRRRCDRGVATSTHLASELLGGSSVSNVNAVRYASASPQRKCSAAARAACVRQLDDDTAQLSTCYTGEFIDPRAHTWPY